METAVTTAVPVTGEATDARPGFADGNANHQVSEDVGVAGWDARMVVARRMAEVVT